MKQTTQALQDTWRAGDFTGDNRPYARVTIHQVQIPTHGYGKKVWSYANFGMNSSPRELPNVKSVTWDRSVDNDAATCVVELYNTLPVHAGETPEPDGNLDRLGWYSPGRGQTTFTNRWGYVTNAWKDWLVPNRILRTYEGYGIDRTKAPEADTHLVPTGVWKIDDVEITTDGAIKLTCRDLTALLLDQIVFPPVQPLYYYPMKWEKKVSHTRTIPHESVDTSNAWKRPVWSWDSGVGGNYISATGTVYGHHAKDAFDTSQSTYWLSIGNDRPNADYAYEYIQGKFSAMTVNSILCHAWGGPYRVYISVYSDGKWQGTSVVPYNKNAGPAAPNGADIPFVEMVTIGYEESFKHKLRREWPNATKIRLTFHNLYNSGQGSFPYRAGVRDIQVGYVDTTVSDWYTYQTYYTGNYSDYTEVVKWLLAIGGFWWPADSKLAVQRWSNGTVHTNPSPTNDAFLGHGAIWGQVEGPTTVGDAELTVDIFDKKPLMDGINYVKDILGFIFFVDDFGRAIFRSPNIWSTGNFLDDGRTTDMIVIDENETLISLRVKMSSLNQREQIFVANVNGKIGAVAKGYDPHPSGLRRIAGWTDQHFASTNECEVMADLIALRQKFDYRTLSLTIPGNPALQIDDQVRVLEGTTAEDYIHYVRGIHSELNMEDGSYIYTLDTHWLGEQPFDKWAFDPSKLSRQTQEYLTALGKI